MTDQTQTNAPTRTLEIRSRIARNGEVTVSLAESPLEPPAEDQVVVRVDAAPINPSDLGLLLPGADLSEARATGTADRPAITATIPEAVLRGLTARLDKDVSVGNEGAGVVIAAGSSPAAQALLGKTVAVLAGGGMYAQYRRVSVIQVRELPPGITAAQGAAAFVNPLTALGFVETMRNEGHRAIVHTAAASNLDQMLVKLCLAEGVPLVNIVRKPVQVQLLRELGATHVLDSTEPDFMPKLIDAVAATSATLAFDAIGGGPLASQILTAMEVAATRGSTVYNRYGSTTLKQVYIYGMLDRSPTQLARNYGMAWSVGGWLVFPALQKVGPATQRALEARVLRDLTTVFASHYTKHLSLAQALDLDTLRSYARTATGEKVLLVPSAP